MTAPAQPERPVAATADRRQIRRGQASLHPQFPALDGYRALAALLVVVCHVWEGLRLVEDEPLLGANYLGYFAVVVFFTLSGFLLYRPFVATHLADRPWPATRRYLRHRFIRMFPLYWVVLTVYFLVGDQNVGGLWEYIRIYGLVQIYSPDTFGRGILPAWTLAVDLTFYLCVPLLALGARSLGKRLGGNRRARLDAELVVVTGFFLIGPIWRCAWLLSGYHRMVDIWLPSQADFFGLGMALAVGSAWVHQGGRLPRAVTWLAARPWLCFVFVVELFWLLGRLELPIARINPIDAFRVSPGDQMARYALYTLAAMLLFVPMVYGRPTAMSARALSSRPLLVVSELSYGIYLWHMLFLVKATEWLGGKDVAGFWPTLYIGLVCTFAAATATYYLVEKPTARLRDRSFRDLFTPRRPNPSARTRASTTA